jgi:ligand-binding SRPBCC domain-containing protein
MPAKLFHFHREITIAKPRAEVFDFFSDALNLETITPPFLNFHVTTARPIEMRQGTLIDYQLKIHGIPVRWRSKITIWEPPFRFADEQLRGPYRVWIHEHRFTEVPGGTLCEDDVQYAPIGGAIINKLLVERDVAKIFAYRSLRLREIFGDDSRGATASRA